MVPKKILRFLPPLTPFFAILRFPDLPLTFPDLPLSFPDLPITFPDLPLTFPDLPLTLPELPLTFPDRPLTFPDLPLNFSRPHSNFSRPPNIFHVKVRGREKLEGGRGNQSNFWEALNLNEGKNLFKSSQSYCLKPP